MVNRSPTSNFQFRHILNMAPTPGKNLKGKQPKKTLTSKVPHGSATPIRKQRKVKCSKCTNTHLPPTGAGCLMPATPLA